MDSKIKENNVPITEKENIPAAITAKKISPLLTAMEADCENRYGVTLIEHWSKAEEIWCSDDGANSVLRCYPYHQKHKQLDGRGPDLFCEATNFVIDFSKVKIYSPLSIIHLH